MDMEMQIEPIVSREEIRQQAQQASEQQMSLHQANPYPAGTKAHQQFEHDFWEHELWLCGQATVN